MKNTQLIDKLQNVTERLLAKRSDISTRLSTLPSGSVAGKVFAFKDNRSLFDWLLVFQHPDDNQLWFAVPGDNICDQIGTLDIDISAEHDGGPRIFRAGAGIWIHEIEIAKCIPIDHVDKSFVSQVHERLSDLTRGIISQSPNLLSTDEDAHYCDWIDTINTDAAQLSDTLYQAEVEESMTGSFPKDFSNLLNAWKVDNSKDSSNNSGLDLVAAQFNEVVLAAASIAAEEDVPGILPVRYDILRQSSEYWLVAFISQNTIALQAITDHNIAPPILNWVDSDAQLHPIKWKTTQPNIHESVEPLSCDNGSIELQFGDGSSTTIALHN